MGRPQLAVRGEPGVELRKRLRPDAVQAALRIRARLDEAGLLEHAEVLGDPRLAEAKAVDEIADGAFALAEQVENREPPWLGENLERGEPRHAPSITL